MMNKLNKIVSVLCFLAIPACLASAGGNLAPNPRFLDGPDDKNAPYGWEYRQTFASPASRGEAYGEWSLEGYGGSRSVSIVEERWFSASQWGSRVEGIEPETYYLFSLRAMRDTDTGWLPKLRLFDQSRLINVKRPGEYLYFEFLLNSKDVKGESDLSLIVFRKPSVIWFSDLRLVEFGLDLVSPVPGEEIRGGGPRFSWELPEHGQAVDFSLTLFREGREEPLFTAGGIQESHFKGPALEPGSYLWKVSVFSGAVLLSQSQKRSFTVKDPPPEGSAPAADLLLTEEFKRQSSIIETLRAAEEFPIGINYLPHEDAPAARGAGINWVFMPRGEVQAYIEAGIKVIGRTGSADADIYYLYDEPEQRGILPADVRKKHRGAGEINDKIPTAVTIYDPDRYMEYAGVSDILMADPYPVPVRPLSSVPEAVLAARSARGGRPVWAIIQAFDWADASAEARREGTTRLPTHGEIKAMSFAAIAAGAEGLVFYTFGQEEAAREELLSRLHELASEIRKINDFLTAPGGEFSKSGPFYVLEKDVPGKGAERLIVNSRPEPAVFEEIKIQPLGVVFEKAGAGRE